MRIRFGSAAAFIALSLGMASCADNSVVGPEATRAGTMASLEGVGVRISEIHYDNTGTDAGEAIEISGPVGTSLVGYSIVLYNGSGGAVYTPTVNLTGSIPAPSGDPGCGDRGVVTTNYASNAIQNGAPDGIALIGPGGVVIEFLSYEGSFTAVGGAAAGRVSTDIGVFENGSEPLGQSLQRKPDGTWLPPATHNFGRCNDTPSTVGPMVSITVSPATATILEGATQLFTAEGFDAMGRRVSGATFTWSSSTPAVASVHPVSGVATGAVAGRTNIIATSGSITGSAILDVEAPPPPPPAGPVFISEINYDPTGTDVDEKIEVEAPAGQNLTGWSLVLYNGNGGASYGTLALTGVVPNLCEGRGVVVVPAVGLQNGSPDGIALVNNTGAVVEFISYEGVMTASNGPANGMVSTDIGVIQNGSPVGRSLQRNPLPATDWYGPATNSFEACNDEELPPPPNTISFSGRNSSDPALPVGFQDQLFATVRNGDGATIATPVVWSSDTPLIATIDPTTGVMTAVAAGTAVFRATTTDGTVTGTWTLPTRVAVSSSTASYLGNAEFGEPADADASDDYIVRRAQFTYSYNRNRATPNWVSYNLEASHFGAEDRCDCFSFDPLLPADYPRYTTADYTGSGTFHGYGIDRGHLARSFDRTSASLDNATTFYFSNIIPQSADLNQQPWANMESYLGDLARFSNKEVYIITGVAGSKGTLKNEGKITIPAQVWKVAVIMPRDQGLANVDSYDDVQVIAVIAPNDPGVGGVDWNTWKTTVDAVEAVSGYDLLSLLPDQVEIAVESNTRPPVAVLNGPYSTMEGGTVNMSASGSTDADGDALTFAWTFSGGGSASGVTTSNSYPQDGAFSVTLTVTDSRGLTSTATSPVAVANVAPSIGSIAGAVLLPGEAYAAAGSFADPGADSWTATVDYGDGSGVNALGLAGMNFSLSHTYGTAGTFTVTVNVSDDDVTSSRTATVTVLSLSGAIGNALAMVEALVEEGAINRGNGNSLSSKLENARKLLDKGNAGPAVNMLQALLNEIDAMVQSGRLAAADAEELQAIVNRIIRSASI